MTNSNDFKDDGQSWWQLARTCSGSGFDRRNFIIFIVWLNAWLLTFLAATWFARRDQGPATALSLILPIVSTLFGFVALYAYQRFLRLSDGLLRQIQYDGFAFGFGAGVVAAVGYRVFEYVGAPEMRVSHVVAIMMIGWIAGQILSIIRYR